MQLIQELNDSVNKLELHATGSPKHVRRNGRVVGTVVKGYLYDRNTDKEVDVEIEYEFERADPGDHYTPSSDAQVHVYKVTREGGGEIPLEQIDTHDFEIDMHDHHAEDEANPGHH